ncbi:MAG: AAA family ATPase [Acutalibacteraceae bacterium]|nr:AAA family ATPase [Acutalibacteraceae bacterium]
MLDVETIKEWWRVFVGDGNMVEVRILGKFQYSGYFKSLDNLIKEIEPYAEMDNEQIYFTLNEINADCYGRQQCEKMVKSPKTTTTDTDIVRRKTVLIDFDPIRATGVNASEAEFELAHKKAQTVFKYLREQGFNDPVIAVSGNGWHLQYFIEDCPNNDDNTETIKRFLQSLSKMYSDDKVDIDEKVFNAGRICKLYGTMAKKGANIPERPWRMSKLVYVPKNIKANDAALFQKIADLLPKEEPKPLPNRQRPIYNSAPFDLPSWLREHGIVYREKKSGNTTLYELEYCPWVDTHSDKKKWDSALFVDGQGKITFNCTHSHCKGKTWHDVRLHYEPNAYDRPAYQPQPMYQPRMYQPKLKYEIKQELPELGEKWLSMSSIQKVDLSKLEHYATGFAELDKNIIGLYMSEVTILSGSNASGKSSWLNTLLLNIIQQGAKVALWSGELRPDILKTWVQMVAAGKNNLRQSTYGDGKYYVPNNIAERIDQWLDGKFFLYNNDYGAKWQQIFHDMELLLKAGVKVFALDNLFSLDIDILDGDKNSKQRELILQIKDFAKKNQVHIILVAHPRKVTTFLRKNDISGTSDLQNAVDKIFIIHRVNNDFFRAGAEFFGQSEIQRFQGFGNVIEVCKERLYGVVDLMVGMQYEIESRRFKNDVNENVQYGWEIEPTQSTMTFNEQPKQQYNADWNYSNDDANNDMPFGAPSDDAAPF